MDAEIRPTSAAAPASVARTQAVAAGAIVLLFGSFMLFGVGFAQPHFAQNRTHALLVGDDIGQHTATKWLAVGRVSRSRGQKSQRIRAHRHRLRADDQLHTRRGQIAQRGHTFAAAHDDQPVAGKEDDAGRGDASRTHNCIHLALVGAGKESRRRALGQLACQLLRTGKVEGEGRLRMVLLKGCTRRGKNFGQRSGSKDSDFLGRQIAGLSSQRRNAARAKKSQTEQKDTKRVILHKLSNRSKELVPAARCDYNNPPVACQILAFLRVFVSLW